MDDILSNTKQQDYYQLLNCNVHSNRDQITAEYRKKALEYHPDKLKKNQQEQETTSNNDHFQLVKQAYEVLSDEETRKQYDAWYLSGIALSYEQWLQLSEETKQSFHWTKKKEKPQIEDEKPTTATTTSAKQQYYTEAEAGSLLSQFRNYQIWTKNTSSTHLYLIYYLYYNNTNTSPSSIHYQPSIVLFSRWSPLSYFSYRIPNLQYLNK